MRNKEQIQGLFLGSVIGDAVGAVLEFNSKNRSRNIILNAMLMPGGGVHGVGEGQPTDDSELSFALLQVLMENDPNEGFPQEKVRDAYHNWYCSNPFDCGYSCRVAFSCKIFDERFQAYNEDSQANGALMRASPISIWTMNFNDDIIAHYARQDAVLSHPNKICQDCNALYCIALAYLLRNHSQNIKCINHIKQYIEEHRTFIHYDVQRWFAYSQNDTLDFHFNPEKNMGWVRWAFILTFHSLMKGKPFEETLYDVISHGGDVDTNASIVMGMMGSFHGINGIPKPLRDKVLSFDCEKVKKGKQRPKHYCTKVVFNKLLEWLNKDRKLLI